MNVSLQQSLVIFEVANTINTPINSCGNKMQIGLQYCG